MNEMAPRRSEHSSDDLGRNMYLTGNFVCNKKSIKSSILVLCSWKNSSCYKPRDCEHFNLGGQGVNPCQMEDFIVSLHYGIQSFFLSCTVVLLHLGLFKVCCFGAFLHTYMVLDFLLLSRIHNSHDMKYIYLLMKISIFDCGWTKRISSEKLLHLYSPSGRSKSLFRPVYSHISNRKTDQ